MAPAENRDITQSIPSFTVAMRGYDRMEVETHLKRIASEVRLFAADRDAALRQADELAKHLDQARARIEELKSHGVEFVNLHDPECTTLMADFIKAHPDLWNEDIGK